jgi:hypothetical protein
VNPFGKPKLTWDDNIRKELKEAVRHVRERRFDSSDPRCRAVEKFYESSNKNPVSMKGVEFFHPMSD